MWLQLTAGILFNLTALVDPGRVTLPLCDNPEFQGRGAAYGMKKQDKTGQDRQPSNFTVVGPETVHLNSPKLSARKYKENLRRIDILISLSFAQYQLPSSPSIVSLVVRINLYLISFLFFDKQPVEF